MFKLDEKGQGAIEYIMLIGGMIVATIIIFLAYKKMTAVVKECAKYTDPASCNATNICRWVNETQKCIPR